MLAFLIETYPKLFQSGRDMYVTAAQYKGLNALAESISRLNSGIDLNDHYLYERSFEDDNTVISISESASNRNYRRFF